MPAKIPTYRKMRSHDEFLCRLREYFPDRSQLKESIVDCLKNQFEVREFVLDDVATILERPHRKATHFVI
jgi:hypothetical protein